MMCHTPVKYRKYLGKTLLMILILLWLSAFIAFQQCPLFRKRSSVMVIAHRGDWQNAPENSLLAIKNCIKMGVDMVEFDLAMSKDSVLVLMHDHTLERTTNGTGEIKHRTYDSLRALSLKDKNGHLTDQKIPSFQEAMEVCRDKILVFVDKGLDYVPQAYEILKKTKTLKQAFFMGGLDQSGLKAKIGIFKNKILYMPLVLNNKSTNDLLKSFENDHRAKIYLFSFTKDDEEYFKYAAALKSRGLIAMATTQVDYYCGGHTDSVSLQNPHLGWGFLLQKGFNAICTDHPQELLDYLRREGLHP
ncbi:MAG: glycerophosphodiester phosphodiesterase family protein [Microscillaceae bacterium]|nr:glycerophosphodiester phosphodiesterase family protein [Microscillaceae bacterium]